MERKLKVAVTQMDVGLAPVPDRLRRAEKLIRLHLEHIQEGLELGTRRRPANDISRILGDG